MATNRGYLTTLDAMQRTANDIDSLTREEAEIVAARALKALAGGGRVGLMDAMQMTHLAVRLERFAREAIAG